MQSCCHPSNSIPNHHLLLQTMSQKLIELSEQEILINFSLNTKCRTTIQIKSLSQTTPISFKLQTSSPHKFLVNPPTGLIQPNSSTSFQIILKPQFQIPLTFPRSTDRFLLKTTTQSESDTSSHDVKLKVYYVGPFLLSHALSVNDIESVKGIVKRQRELVSTLPADFRFLAMGWRELHVAAAFDRVDDVERLVSFGDVDVRDKEGWTALHLAATNGHLESVGVLVEAGADVDARSKDGRTALSRAVENGDFRMVEVLIGAGADVEGRNGFIVDLARDKGHKEIVTLLERGEAVLNAARRGELDILESLLEKGANMNFSDQYGLTALHVASFKGNKDVVMILLDFGADVESQDKEGHTPLHLAVEGGNIETVEVLINRGAAINAKSKKGATPLYVSELMENEELTELLLGIGAVI